MPRQCERLRRSHKGAIASVSGLTIKSHVVGIRPIPEDGFPVVGRAPGIAGLYVAITHSGITLAPAIDHFVADELLTPYAMISSDPTDWIASYKASHDPSR